jgi:short-subunit dehydrogenase
MISFQKILSFKKLNHPYNNIKSRNVLVVGASSGIGFALANLLRSNGARVFVAARRGFLLEENFEKENIFQIDITNSDEIKNLFDELNQKHINIDTVIWCPGIYTPMNFKNFDVDEAEKIVLTNFSCVFRPFSLMINYWLKNKAILSSRSVHWIWISSVAGYRGLPGSVAYGPSKAAINNLAEASYIELRSTGINISLVCPGFVESRLTEKNDFKMPAIITAEEAADHILKGLKKGKFEIHFPKRFTNWLKMINFLPYWLYFKIIKSLQ